MNVAPIQFRAAPPAAGARTAAARTAAGRAAAVAMLLALSACVAPQAAVRAPAKGPPVPAPVAAGLDRVIGKDARALQVLLGAPDQDVREEGARKLQYASSVCVLDAYLYARTAGREPVVTWIDARLPNGDDIDRASCIAALSRRIEAR
nr:hypothetical protein [Sphingomonas bacterium]